GLPGQALGQLLFDAMFVDLDGGLRELGVSDLSVGTHVKRLAGNFYARLAALDEGLGDTEPATGSQQGAPLRPMLRANVYHGAAPSDRQVAALARALAEQDRALARHAGAALCGGTIAWVEPEVTSGS
ncbi:MAG: ubiquinol-cytochrome C chaperone family protein, partial [Geminicoccaceae bacterium]